jgi:hypothetical protein
VLEVIAQPDHAKPFALSRRHLVDGRITYTIISRWPTKNSAFDALYAERNSLILPHNLTAIPSTPLVIERRRPPLERVVTAGGTVAAILTLAAIALVGGAWFGMSTATADGGIARPAEPASYTITLDH